MIVAHELRLGSVINYVRGDLVVKTKVVDHNLLAILTNPENTIDIACHQPVKINEEWLVKLGAEKRLNRYLFFEPNSEKSKWFVEKYVNDKWMVCLFVGGYPDYSIHILCFINHVHQLQNLYSAITQEELTVK